MDTPKVIWIEDSIDLISASGYYHEVEFQGHDGKFYNSDIVDELVRVSRKMLEWLELLEALSNEERKEIKAALKAVEGK